MVAGSRFRSAAHQARTREAVEVDAWEELISAYLAVSSKVTVTEVAKSALSFDTARIGTADQRRIAAVMDRLGWRRANGNKTDCNGKRWWINGLL